MSNTYSLIIIAGADHESHKSGFIQESSVVNDWSK